MVPRVDTARHVEGTPTRGSNSQNHAGSTRSHRRINNASIHLQLQHTGGENGDPPGRHRPAQCGNLDPGFVEPAPPGEDKVPSPDQKYCHTSTTSTNRGRKRRLPGSIPPRIVWKHRPGQRHPETITSHPQIRNPRMTLQLQQTGDENGGPPGSIPPRTLWKPQPRDRRSNATRGG